MKGLPGKGSVALALLLTVTASGSACAMSSTSTGQLRCVVQGEDLLPPELGGQAAVCSAIQQAATPVLQRAGIAPAAVSVSVQVTSQSTISATASVGGTSRPEQHVATSDRLLNPGAIDMLARAVASDLSKLTQ